MSDERLVTVEEAMQRLGVSRVTIWRMEVKGELTGALFHGKKRYLESDIVELEDAVFRDIEKRKQAYARVLEDQSNT